MWNWFVEYWFIIGLLLLLCAFGNAQIQQLSRMERQITSLETDVKHLHNELYELANGDQSVLLEASGKIDWLVSPELFDAELKAHRKALRREADPRQQEVLDRYWRMQSTGKAEAYE